MSTQTIAMMRLFLIIELSLIAMKRTRMCGMPKYPRPQTRPETIVTSATLPDASAKRLR